MSVRRDDFGSLRLSVTQTVDAVRSTSKFGSPDELAACVCATLAANLDQTEAKMLPSIALEEATRVFIASTGAAPTDDEDNGQLSMRLPGEINVTTTDSVEAKTELKVPDIDVEVNACCVKRINELATDAQSDAVPTAVDVDSSERDVTEQPAVGTDTTVDQPSVDEEAVLDAPKVVPTDAAVDEKVMVTEQPATDDEALSTSSATSDDLLHAKLDALIEAHTTMQARMDQISFLVEHTIPVSANTTRAALANFSESFLFPEDRKRNKEHRAYINAPTDLRTRVNDFLLTRRGVTASTTTSVTEAIAAAKAVMAEPVPAAETTAAAVATDAAAAAAEAEHVAAAVVAAVPTEPVEGAST